MAEDSVMNIDKAPTTIGTKRPGETRPTRDSPRAAPVPPQTPSSRQAQPPRPIPFNPRVQSSSIQDAQSSTPYERTHVDFGAIDPFGNAQNSTSKLAPTLSIREWVIGATNFVKNALAFVRDVPSEANLLNNPDFGPIYRELKLVLGDTSASPAVTQVAVSTPTQSTPTPNDERDPKIYAILESISERLQTIENTTTTTKSTSYAAAAGKAVNQSKPTPKNIGPHPDFKPIPSPSQRHHPARLVIQATTPMDPSHRLTVLATRDKINEALDGTGAPKPLRVVAVRWNEKGNCIVMVQDDQRAADLMPYVDSFAHLVCGTSAWTAVPDQAWTRVLVHGVDTGMSDSDMNDTPYNSTELHEELVRSNPWLANVKLGCATRWLAKPETVATKHHSSIIISFCDEEDANTLINRRRGLFAFGRFAKVNRYVDTPTARQCTRCWSFDHRVRDCRMLVKCRICADSHAANEHICETCPPPANRAGCEHHPAKCVNCEGEHPADFRRCRDRMRRQGEFLKEYAKPKSGGGRLTRTRKTTAKKKTNDTGPPTSV